MEKMSSDEMARLVVGLLDAPYPGDTLERVILAAASCPAAQAAEVLALIVDCAEARADRV